MNCAVMVDATRYLPELRKMVDVIYGHSLAAGLPIEEESIAPLLVEAMNHYLIYCLSNSTAKNLAFDYYLDEYFQAEAPYLRQQPEVMNFLASQFAQISGQIHSQLLPAVDKLDLHGQTVEDLTILQVTAKHHMYVVQGEGFDHDDSSEPE